MLWIDVGIKDTPLLKFIIVLNISTNPLLVSKMKLSMQMCQSSWFECILFMYEAHLKFVVAILEVKQLAKQSWKI